MTESPFPVMGEGWGGDDQRTNHLNHPALASFDPPIGPFDFAQDRLWTRPPIEGEELGLIPFKQSLRQPPYVTPWAHAPTFYSLLLFLSNQYDIISASFDPWSVP
jgi:hypothetical protein